MQCSRIAGGSALSGRVGVGTHDATTRIRPVRYTPLMFMVRQIGVRNRDDLLRSIPHCQRRSASPMMRKGRAARGLVLHKLLLPVTSGRLSGAD